jgi:hypothetical protein
VTSLILPTYNPGPGVDRTWEAVAEFVRSRPDPWDVLFVCDGCSDGTPERLSRLADATADRRLGVLHYPRNRGKGHAVRTGLLAARGAYRVFTDVDLAYGFDDVVRVANALRAGADVAIASREHPDSVIQLPPRHLGYAYRRRVQSRVFGKLARCLLPISTRDTQAGLKGMTGAVADRLLPLMRCDGFGFDCELLTGCARLGVPVTEVPVCVRYEDASSTTGAGSTVRMLRELWRIRKAWKHGPPTAPAVLTDDLREMRYGSDRLLPQEAKAA